MPSVMTHCWASACEFAPVPTRPNSTAPRYCLRACPARQMPSTRRHPNQRRPSSPQSARAHPEQLQRMALAAPDPGGPPRDLVHARDGGRPQPAGGGRSPGSRCSSAVASRARPGESRAAGSGGCPPRPRRRDPPIGGSNGVRHALRDFQGQRPRQRSPLEAAGVSATVDHSGRGRGGRRARRTARATPGLAVGVDVAPPLSSSQVL